MTSPHPDSKWTHAICSDCYDLEEPGRRPTVLIAADDELCCFCGKETDDGIYYRKDPVVVHG